RDRQLAAGGVDRRLTPPFFSTASVLRFRDAAEVRPLQHVVAAAFLPNLVEHFAGLVQVARGVCVLAGEPQRGGEQIMALDEDTTETQLLALSDGALELLPGRYVLAAVQQALRRVDGTFDGNIFESERIRFARQS